jgi:hypothetical protein
MNYANIKEAYTLPLKKNNILQIKKFDLPKIDNSEIKYVETIAKRHSGMSWISLDHIKK